MLTLIRCPFHPCVTAVAHKRPWSFCQKCRWQVTPKHTYTLDPAKSVLADYGLCPGIVWEPIRKGAHMQLLENIRPQQSQLAEPLWTDHGLKSGISVRKLMFTLKKKIKKNANRHRQGMNGQTFSHTPHKQRKKPPFFFMGPHQTCTQSINDCTRWPHALNTG